MVAKKWVGLIKMASLVFLIYATAIQSVLLVASEALQPVDVQVTFDNESSPQGFKVLLSGEEWLRSGAFTIRDSGQTWASGNNDKYMLKVVDHSTGAGSDAIGEFDTNM